MELQIVFDYPEWYLFNMIGLSLFNLQMLRRRIWER